MNIICVDTDRRMLMHLWRDALRVAPNANVQKFDAIGEAIRYALGIRCDVLLADLKSGCAVWDGTDLAKEIQKTNPQVNVIFFSSEPLEQNEHILRDIRISGYIRRPYVIEQLTEEMNRLCYPRDLVANSSKGSLRT